MSAMLMVVRNETHFVNTMEYVTGYVDVLLIKTMRMLTMLLPQMTTSLETEAVKVW